MTPSAHARSASPGTEEVSRSPRDGYEFPRDVDGAWPRRAWRRYARTRPVDRSVAVEPARQDRFIDPPRRRRANAAVRHGRLVRARSWRAGLLRQSDGLRSSSVLAIDLGNDLTQGIIGRPLLGRATGRSSSPGTATRSARSPRRAVGAGNRDVPRGPFNAQGAARDALQRIHGVDHLQDRQLVQRPGQDVSAPQPPLRIDQPRLAQCLQDLRKIAHRAPGSQPQHVASSRVAQPDSPGTPPPAGHTRLSVRSRLALNLDLWTSRSDYEGNCCCRQGTVDLPGTVYTNGLVVVPSRGGTAFQ